MGAFGTAMAILLTLPIPPLAKGVMVTALAVAYLIAQALVDRAKEQTKVQEIVAKHAASLISEAVEIVRPPHESNQDMN